MIIYQRYNIRDLAITVSRSALPRVYHTCQDAVEGYLEESQAFSATDRHWKPAKTYACTFSIRLSTWRGISS